MAEPKHSELPNNYVDNYDVFVSFRGKDTRGGFTSHLYKALKEAGIHVFLDNEELTYGKRLDEELPQAIRNSRIYIPVLSEEYASSKWCLHELAEIVKNKQEFDREKEILPVFYKVTTDDVKLKTDLFKNHLNSHMRKETDQTVEEWSKALKSIPKRRGWGVPIDSSKGDAEFCQEIVKRVSVMLKVKHMQVPQGLIGMDDPVKKLMKLLDIASPDVQIIGIYGMGGIGKTTLAKVVYNKLCDSFDCYSFLGNVRESLYEDKGGSGCLELQRKLLKDVRNQEEVEKIRDTDDAISKIQRSLRGKMVLMVFDDVSKPTQIEKIIGNSYDSFGCGSRIIITTRDYQNIQLKGGRDVKVHEMEELKKEDALQLFSWHAFGRLSPPEEFQSISEDIVSNLTEGLPLSLEVIGSLLYRKSKEAWQSTIQKLRLIPHKDIQKKLMVSYDDLSHEAKEIFLDIACFFVDEERTYEAYMWEACGFFPQSSIDELVSLCLIKIKEDKYWVHDHIKDLGRETVRQEGLEDQVRRSRFWMKADGINILSRTQKEDNNIKAIRLLDLEVADINEMWTLKSGKFANLEKLRFLQMDVDQNPLFSREFEKLKLEGALELFFPNLRWLSLYHASEEQLNVTKFNLKKLVILDLSYSDISEAWDGWKELMGLHSLEVLDLTGCDYLTETPDLSQLTSLKRLILRFCLGLEYIDPSIINLKELKYLDCTGCSSLQCLPEEVFTLIHLEEIIGDFTGYSYTFDESTIIPKSVGELASLVTLRLRRLRINALPDVIGMLINLQSLDLSYCETLESLPDSIGGLVKLEHLLLEHCSGLVSLPDSLTSLPKLQSLVLSFCRKLESLPDSVGEMVLLKEMDISFTGLKKLPRFVAMQKKLEKLNARWTKLEGIPSEIEELPNLRVASLRGSAICGFPSQLVQPSRLEDLNLESCDHLKQLPELPASLVKLSISSASLQSVPDLSCLTNLTELKLILTTRECELNCFNINSIGRLLKLKKLNLSIRGFMTTTIPIEFFNLSQLEQVTLQCLGSETCVMPLLSRLKEVKMSLYKGTTSLSVARLDCLVHFHLSECVDLAQIHGLGGLVSLESLTISCCNSLDRLDGLSKLRRRLTYLEIKECKKLRVIHGVPDLQSLKKLYILGCESLECLSESEKEAKELGDAKGSKSPVPKLKMLIEVVRIENCPMLRDLQCLEGLTSLKNVQINDCPSLEGHQFNKLLLESTTRSRPKLKDAPCLEDLKLVKVWNVERRRFPKELSDLSTLQRLKEIQIIRCETPIEITGLGELPSLYALKIKHCNSIQRLNIDDMKSLGDLYIGYCHNLNDIGNFPYNVLPLRQLVIRDCALLKNKLSIKEKRMIKGVTFSNMMIKGTYLDYEPVDDLDNEEEEDEKEVYDDNNEKEDDDDKDEEEEEEEAEIKGTNYGEKMNGCPSAMDLIVLPETASPWPSPSPTFLPDHPLPTRNDEGKQPESCSHDSDNRCVRLSSDNKESDRTTTLPTGSSFNMKMRGFSMDMSSEVEDPSSAMEKLSIYEQLNSLLLDEGSTNPSPVGDTKEAKAVLKRFLFGGIEMLEEGESFNITPMLDAAKALSLANPRDSGFWDNFSSKLQLASSFYKLNFERVQAAEVVRARYDELKESAEEITTRYKVLQNKTDHIRASKEKMLFESDELRAQLAEIENKVAEADQKLKDVASEGQAMVGEMEGRFTALKATKDEIRTKDAKQATSEAWLMSLKADWNSWIAYLD